MKIIVGKDEEPHHRLTAKWLWEPRDIWIGVFWNRTSGERLLNDYLLIYVCIIPCLPIAIAWRENDPTR